MRQHCLNSFTKTTSERATNLIQDQGHYFIVTFIFNYPPSPLQNGISLISHPPTGLATNDL